MPSDDYPTDSWLKRCFETYYDPCPLHGIHTNVDALKIPWSQYHDQIFINPPYSNPLPWVEKAILERELNPCVIVMLLKHDSSTKWWAKLHEAGARFLPIIGRLRHETPTPAPFPSVLVIL